MTDDALDIEVLSTPLSEVERKDARTQLPAPPNLWTPIIPAPACAPPLDVIWNGEGKARLYDACWPYRNESGDLIGFAVRWNRPDGGKHCSFALWCRGPNGIEQWRLKHHPEPRPLYGLDRLAARPDVPVIVVEGEKCADAAATIFHDRVVVTSPAGANAADKADWKPLANRPAVLLWPDADIPGTAYAETVARKLHALGVEDIHVVDARRLSATGPDGKLRAPVEGWDAADALAEKWDPAALRQAVVAMANPPAMGPVYRSFDIFQMTEKHGLRAEVSFGKGKNITVETIRISRAFEVLGRARDPVGRGWARYIRWKDDDGRSHTHAVKDAELHGDPKTLAAELAGKGLKIEIGRGPLLVRYLNEVQVQDRVTIVQHTGWHDIAGEKAFILPEGGITASRREKAILDTDSASPYEARGSLDDWSDGVGRLVSGHGRPTLAVAMAFAGPLLAVAGMDGGGVNLYGPSSSGKTTCAEAAASVWGKGASPGYVRSWRQTANAVEAGAANTTDTILILDEIGVMDAREVGTAAYQLAAGTGKGRSARDGSMRPPMTWRVLVLSTGEMAMPAKMAEDRGRRAQAGQMVRLLDIPSDAGCGFGAFDHLAGFASAGALSDAIKKCARTAYGTAGPAFVRRLLAEGYSDVSALVMQMVDDFTVANVPAGADGQVGRAARRLGLIGAAGELAQTWGIVPWTEGDAMAAARRAFADWLAERGGTDAAETKAAVQQVRRFIEAHGDARFDPIDAGSDHRPVSNRAGWRKGSDASRQWFILPETWKTEVCGGLDPALVARTLADRGMLNPDASGKFQRSERTPHGTKRVHVITAAILEGDE